jgi:hypothetical protein
MVLGIPALILAILHKVVASSLATVVCDYLLYLATDFRVSLTARPLPFTGLLACASCERNLSTSRHKRSLIVYDRCQYRQSSIYRCDGVPPVHAVKVQKAIDELLHFAVDDDESTLLEPEQNITSAQISDLEQSLKAVESNIDILISEQLVADITVRRYYAQRIAAAGQQADGYRAELEQLRLRQTEQRLEHNERLIALDELRKITLDEFWKLAPRRINQLLHRILRGRRLVIQEDEILRVV